MMASVVGPLYDKHLSFCSRNRVHWVKLFNMTLARGEREWALLVSEVRGHKIYFAWWKY
jgi:hypothetical protein